METATKRLYEGMFLVDSGEAASDWKGINDAIEKILTRNGAEIISLRKWDERKLAYDVSRKSRGTYILAYFNGDPLQITSIERDVNLSELIVRVLILRRDKVDPEDLNTDTPAMIMEKRELAAKEAAAKDAVAKEEAAKEAAAKAAAEPVEVAEPQVVVESAVESIEESEQVSQEVSAEPEKDDE